MPSPHPPLLPAMLLKVVLFGAGRSGKRWCGTMRQGEDALGFCLWSIGTSGVQEDPGAGGDAQRCCRMGAGCGTDRLSGSCSPRLRWDAMKTVFSQCCSRGKILLFLLGKIRQLERRIVGFCRKTSRSAEVSHVAFCLFFPPGALNPAHGNGITKTKLPAPSVTWPLCWQMSSGWQLNPPGSAVPAGALRDIPGVTTAVAAHPGTGSSRCCDSLIRGKIRHTV